MTRQEMLTKKLMDFKSSGITPTKRPPITKKEYHYKGFVICKFSDSDSFLLFLHTNKFETIGKSLKEAKNHIDINL